jgi:hypothetical protein
LLGAAASFYNGSLDECDAEGEKLSGHDLLLHRVIIFHDLSCLFLFNE